MISALIKKLKNEKLIVDIGIYAIATIVTQAIPFLLLPVLTRFLSPEEYGFVAMFGVLLGISNIFVGTVLISEIKRNFFAHDQEFVARQNTNILCLMAFSSTVMTIVLYFFSDYTTQALGFPGRWLLLIPVLSFSILLSLIQMVILRCKSRPLLFAIIQISSTALNLGLSLLLIIIFDKGWEGRLAGIAAGAVFAAIWGAYWIIRNGYLKPNFDTQRMKTLLITTAPLVPGAFFALTIQNMGKLVINHEYTKVDVGLYNTGVLVGMIVFFLGLSCINGLEPWIYRQVSLKSENTIQNIARVLTGFLICMAAVALAISVASQLILSVMTTSAYFAADAYVAWIAFGYAFWAMYAAVSPLYIHRKKHRILMRITATGALFNMVSTIILVKYSGPVGAAQSFLFTYMIMFLASFFYVQKMYRIRWGQALGIVND